MRSNKQNIEEEYTLVMAFGTFDYLHAGHEQYLKKAKALGDELIVVIARDKTVKQIKGRPATNSERKRAKSIRNLNIADRIILGYHGDKHKVLRKYRPNTIALGYDQFVFTQKLKKTLIDLKLNAKIIRIDSYFPQVYKSSILRNMEKTKNELEKDPSLKIATIK